MQDEGRSKQSRHNEKNEHVDEPSLGKLCGTSDDIASSIAMPRATEVPMAVANLDTTSSSDDKDAAAGKEFAAAAKAARTALLLEEDLQFESGFMSFPEKLMSLLEGNEVQDAMWWLPEGDAFCLVPTSFDTVLDKHFQGTKFESFTRKLNRW